MRTAKGTVLCTVGIAVAIAAVGVGDVIMGTENGWVAFFEAMLACALLGVALILCVLGVNAENEEIRRENKKIERVPYHTNEWRDAQ